MLMACVVQVFYDILYCLGGIQANVFVQICLDCIPVNWLRKRKNLVIYLIFPGSWSGDFRFRWLAISFQAKAQLCWLALQSIGDQQLVLDMLFLVP